MDELKKLLEGVFASVEDQGVKALSKTEGWDTLEESKQNELTEAVKTVSSQITESLHDSLLTKLSEHLESVEDKHQAEIVEAKEEHDKETADLKEKAEEYGEFLITEAEKWKESEFAEYKKSLVEHLDDYIEMAFAEKVKEAPTIIESQKAKAFEYLSEQLGFIMGQVKINVAEDEASAARMSESTDLNEKVSDLEDQLAEANEELAEFKRIQAVADIAHKNKLSESQTEKLNALSEHLDSGSDRFPARLESIVEMVKTGKKPANTEDDNLSENYKGDDSKKDKPNSAVSMYLSAAKRMGNRRF